MGFISVCTKAAIGAGALVALVVALPIAGPIGAITATGAKVASVVGALVGATKEILDAKEEKR